MTLSSSDIVEIQQLAAAYCHHMDDGNGAAVAALFVDDGVLEIVDMVKSVGHEEITANCSVFPQIMPGGRHIVQNMFVEGDGDSATLRAYLSNVTAGDTPTAVQTGRYADEAVRTDQGWRFSRRTLTLDGPLF